MPTSATKHSTGLSVWPSVIDRPSICRRRCGQNIWPNYAKYLQTTNCNSAQLCKRAQSFLSVWFLIKLTFNTSRHKKVSTYELQYRANSPSPSWARYILKYSSWVCYCVSLIINYSSFAFDLWGQCMYECIYPLAGAKLRKILTWNESNEWV